ncbi:MAG: hypothetical protein RMI90_05355 [Thermoguttaceae bacterium]|nr:hypothetical protein [Thermoguttaceae bacterium]
MLSKLVTSKPSKAWCLCTERAPGVLVDPERAAEALGSPRQSMLRRSLLVFQKPITGQ